MDVRTESPFWLIKNGYLKNYFALRENISADYAIIGGGITGALMLWYLAKAGVDAVLVDRRHFGTNSTCASTGLLQYEIDTPLFELSEKVGEKNAARSYLLCLEAIEKLDRIAEKLPLKINIERRPSFFYASRKKDVEDLKKEFQIRRKHGIELEFWDEEKICENFPFRAPAALFSKSGGQVDAYRLTHGLIEDSVNPGARVFDKTEIKLIETEKRGIKLLTSAGCEIKAKKLIVACGYESVNYLPMRVGRLHSTYALISEPFAQKNLWHQNCLIWETAKPYLYLRTTDDNRIIVGGKDEPFYSPKKRDRLLHKKQKDLEKAFIGKFPDLEFRTDYAWAGTFGETEDGLPYIGSVKQLPHTIFALGFGGNGITFSQIAAEIVRDQAVGKKNADAKIFSFERIK